MAMLLPLMYKERYNLCSILSSNFHYHKWNQEAVVPSQQFLEMTALLTLKLRPEYQRTSTASMVYWSGFLAAYPYVPGSIPGPTRL
jgi:hypothetical protein